MTFSNILRIAASSTFLFAMAGIATAQGPVVGANTTTSELAMTANVDTAVQLNISTGAGGATVTGSNATGLFAVNFGNINGLGSGTPAAGVTVAIDGVDGALYTTPINLTPVYSGFTTETAALEVSQDGLGDITMTREGATAGTTAEVSTGIPTPVAAGVASGATVERFVGFYVARGEESGAKVSTLIYTVTVAL